MEKLVAVWGCIEALIDFLVSVLPWGESLYNPLFISVYGFLLAAITGVDVRSLLRSSEHVRLSTKDEGHKCTLQDNSPSTLTNVRKRVAFTGHFRSANSVCIVYTFRWTKNLPPQANLIISNSFPVITSFYFWTGISDT